MRPHIEPCPFCGNTLPFTHISASCVVMRCSCGVEVSNPEGAARTMYPRAEVPEELIPGMYEFDSRANLDPEKDYVGISASWALEHSGALAIWNRRA